LKFFLFFFAINSLIFAQNKKQNKYIGAQKCGMCHRGGKIGAQYKLWQKRKHSKSYKALLSEKGIKLAKSYGLGKASEAKVCLNCHAPTALIDEKLVARGVKIENGVQCETCHGAGQHYRSMKIMKNKIKAIENGLVELAAIKALCVKCHKGDEHTGKFDFEKAWKQVKHPVPEK